MATISITLLSVAEIDADTSASPSIILAKPAATVVVDSVPKVA